MSDAMPPGRLQALPADGIHQLVRQVTTDLERAGFPPEATAVAGGIVTRALHRVRIARRPRPPRPWNGNGGPPLSQPR